MYTSVVFIALAAFFGSGKETEQLQWKEYGVAQKQGILEKKPLAVFFGSGREGWKQVSQEGKLNKEVKRLLADHYVCVYLDRGDDDDRDLASAFEMPRGPGIVLSSHSGEIQAFRYRGDLSNGDLAQHLRFYADPTRSDRISYYPPDSSPSPQSGYQPGYYRSYGGGGRSC